MLRLKAIRMLPLNCASSGVLYHYTPTWEALESILENGLMVSDKEIAYDKEAPYVSLARTKTGAANIDFEDDETGDRRWKYGVILSKEKLRDFGKIRPHHFAAAINELEFSIIPYDDHIDVKRPGYPSVSVANKGNTSYEEFQKAVKWLEKNVPDIYISGNEDTGIDVVGTLPEGISFKDLPIVLQNYISRSGDNASEDRLFPKNANPGDYLEKTKNAIIGVVVPRDEYYSEEAEEFRDAHPNMPMYAYARSDERSWNRPEKPLPKEAYRNPVA